MRLVWRALARRIVGLFAMAGFLASVLAAGQTYFFCRMTEEVQTHCCCQQKLAPNEAVVDRDLDCCEVRTHAAPGNAVQPVHAPAAMQPVASLGAPVAVVPRAEIHVARAVLPDWTGPPLDQRRALISVFLL